MDFYKQKIQAYKMIDEMVKEGRPLENIYFKVETILWHCRFQVAICS